MIPYDPQSIEQKRREKWLSQNTYATPFPSTKPKYYCLVEFPYPSGAGLHVGHPRPYTAMDVIARKRRMQGYNVLFPMGYDSFGLPTENYAIKTGQPPALVTERNIANFTRQLQMLGYSFDWNRQVDTSDSGYYKWTQWIFLQLLKHDLAYQSEISINWCPACITGLANEEVVGGCCERCGAPVQKRKKKQWILRITAYAQRLLDDLDGVDYIERIKSSQRNWIGRSTGATVDFDLSNGEKLTVFTTRPDTLYGVTYMVLAPEHELVARAPITNMAQVQEYAAAATAKSDIERTGSNEKTGVRLEGITATNPLTGKQIPLFISDYVLAGYGTGAIMAVPGHDQRDWEFAKAFDLPIVEVVSGGDVDKEAFVDIEQGTMINSGFMDGMKPSQAINAAIEEVEKRGIGKQTTQFKLRDWVFSRQRYWGEPIPVVHCDACGCVPLPEEQLPLMPPQLDHYRPAEDGQSPLARCQEWVNTTCPHCGGPARRETDTMPNWAGSSWYFLRYCDPKNTEAFASPEALDYFMNVDWYNGGMEHATLHVLYSRFWHKFLFDLGLVSTCEPYAKRTSHGNILAENGERMSKSRGNVINPDDVVKELGADAFRTYIMFIGAFDAEVTWSTSGARGCRRFLDRVWKLQDLLAERDMPETLAVPLHRTIKKVGEDIERMKFNTAIAALMALVNDIYDAGVITPDIMRPFLRMLYPFAPHMAEEMSEMLGFGDDLTFAPWPEYNPALCTEATIEMVAQVNGKVRARFTVTADATQDDMQAAALAALDDLPAEPKRILVVPGRLVNVVL